jgi:hypothetical protein
MPLINKLLYKYAETKPTFSGNCAFFGNDDKGWIEIYENGTITIPKGIKKVCDIYLLTDGGDAAPGGVTNNETTAGWYTIEYYGKGGDGGTAMEYYGKTLSGKYTISIESTETRMIGLINSITTTLTTNTTGNISGGKGGLGKIISTFTPNGTSQHQTNVTPAKPGEWGRKPFTGHNPMNEGHCALLLGAGGDGEVYVGNDAAKYQPTSTSIYKNCGAGQNGKYGGDLKGWPGIVIIRWGY